MQQFVTKLIVGSFVVIAIPVLTQAVKAERVFYASFDKDFSAISKSRYGKADKSGSGIALSEPNQGCTQSPAGRALDQQNVATHSEHDGEISYSAYYNFSSSEGTLSMWVKRNGGGTYNTFFGAGNAIWSPNSTFCIFYVPSQKKVYFRYRSADKSKHLDAVINSTMAENTWYHIVCSWRRNKNGGMQLTAYLATEGAPVSIQADAKNWSESIVSPLGMFGKKGKMWIGSGTNGMTPANSLIDEVIIWNKAMSFSEVIAAEKMITGFNSLNKSASKFKMVEGKQISPDDLKGFDGWGKMLIPVPKLGVMPSIDGKISKQDFSKLSEAGINFALDELKPAPNKSQVGFGRYGDNLYVAVKSYFSPQKRLVTQNFKPDSPVYEDDCVEIYLYGEQSKEYCQWIVNSSGILFDAKNRDANWESNIKLAATKSSGEWIAEFMIPISSLKIGPMSQLKINVTRNDKTIIPSILSSMIPLKGKSFFQPKRFASLLPINESQGVQVSNNFIAGPAGQNGFNSTYTFPKEYIGCTVVNLVSDAVTGKNIFTQSLPAKGSQVSFDHFLTTTQPVVEQIIFQKGSLITANIVNIFKTQAEVNQEAGKISKEKYTWIGNKIGKDHSVPAPFTPVSYKDGSVKVILRDYLMKNSSLFSQISVLGQQLLTRNIELKIAKNRSLSFSTPEIVEQYPDYIKISRKVKIGNSIVGILYIKVDFDGFVWCELNLNNISLNKLALVIPLNPELMYSLTSTSAVDTARNKQIKLLNPGVKLDLRFIRSLWLGSEKGGIGIFAESDEDWRNNNLRKVIEVNCQDKSYKCKINFISTPTKITNSKFSWGMLVTPTRKIVRSVDKDMAWININHPEVLQNELKDYPGQEKDFIKWLAKEGVKQIVLFDYWASYQGGHIATYPEAIKNIVKRCHKEGMKILLYRSRELSTADPLWKDFSKISLCTPTSYGYRRTSPVKQISYVYCPKSLLQDYFIWSCDWLMREYGVDGFYLDSPAHVSPCFNEAHGCGYKSKSSTDHVTYAIIQTREMLKRLYRVVKKYKPNGLLDAHGSFTPTEAFLTSRFVGEQFYKMRHYDDEPSRILPADAFRTIFCSNTGPGMNMLMYSGCPFTPDEAAAISFIHGVSMRPHSLHHLTGRNSLIKTAKIWKAFNDFGVDDAEWIPYWSKKFKLPYVTQPKAFGQNKEVKISYYKKGNDYLYLIASSAVHEAKIIIANPALKPHKIKAVNMLTGNPVCTQDDSMWTIVEPYHLLVIKVTPEK